MTSNAGSDGLASVGFKQTCKQSVMNKIGDYLNLNFEPFRCHHRIPNLTKTELIVIVDLH